VDKICSFAVLEHREEARPRKLCSDADACPNGVPGQKLLPRVFALKRPEDELSPIIPKKKYKKLTRYPLVRG